MPWLRLGDTFHTDPLILALIDPKDPMMGPACKGFFVDVATLSAQNKTDYVITPGFVHEAGGPVADLLLRRCIRAGLIIPLGGRGTDRRWKIIDTRHDLVHIRTRAEIDWEKQQKADTHRKAFQLVVFARDGDACRWCGVPVQPNDHRSRRAREIDHLRPGLPADGPDDLVVACKSCNSKRGADWDPIGETPDQFSARWADRLRPVPTPLLFVRSTVNFLEDNGVHVPDDSVIIEKAPKVGDTVDTPPTSGQDPAHPAPAGVAPPARRTTAPRQHPATQAGVAATAPAPRTTRSRTQPDAAAPPSKTAHQHPTPPVGVADASTTAPEDTQHPAATAGVAGPESRDHPSTTDRSRAGRPGRVGSGRSAPSRDHPPSGPSLPAAPQPRKTRRGRRRPRLTPEQEP